MHQGIITIANESNSLQESIAGYNCLMLSLEIKRLKAYQSKTFRISPDLSVRTRHEAINFVNQRGFIFFWPISGITFPSLWTSVAGNRPVASKHDDPGHISWGWKDDSLGERVWYYAKVLRKKATIISLNTVAYFYALSENYDDYEHDYLTQYEQGRLTAEAKTIYESLLENGPLDTISLRHLSRLTSRSSDSRFNTALSALQSDFKIMPIGIARAGGWNYAFIYDIVARYWPDLPERAYQITEKEAHLELTMLYYQSVGAARINDVIKIFGWSKRITEQTLNQLCNQGRIYRGITISNYSGEWYALPDLL
jgi:hypothetical protein